MFMLSFRQTKLFNLRRGALSVQEQAWERRRANQMPIPTIHVSRRSLVRVSVLTISTGTTHDRIDDGQREEKRRGIRQILCKKGKTPA